MAITYKTHNEWADPELIASFLYNNNYDMVFLYSSINSGYSGDISIIAYDLAKKLESDNIDELNNILSNDKNKFDNCWFGYLGYELKNNIEKLPIDDESFISSPSLLFAKFHNIIIFNHQENNIYIHSNNHENVSEIIKKSAVHKIHDNSKFDIEDIYSNMSKKEYMDNLDYIKQKIINGDIYQANLTRKFYGHINKSNNNIADIFINLSKISPASYSSFIRIGDLHILSSSPEQFIKIDAKGNIETRPIKGSSPRYKDKDKDKESKLFLENSIKDKAENLMIVDLMRNDLSKSSEIGSVKVEDLFKVTSYKTIHHMDSTITSRKENNISTLSAIKNSFPPGSMTGTPKIRAMEICSEVEKQKRGIYSGAIGYFAGDGSCDLSVVIRTLIIKDNKFEFQVGGAITFDSDKTSEWEETITKATALVKVLGITKYNLKEL